MCTHSHTHTFCREILWKNEMEKKHILKLKKNILCTQLSVSVKGGKRGAWQGLIRLCNSNNNVFIKLINWESRGNCYVSCRLTMLLMLKTVKLTNNKLWNMDFLPSQRVLITYHLSIAKGNCQDGISDKMLTCDKTHLPARTIQFEIEFVRLSRKTFFLILTWGKVILIKKKRTERKFFLYLVSAGELPHRECEETDISKPNDCTTSS